MPALVGFLPVFVLAVQQGGYFPWAWGWASLGLLWAAGAALVVRSNVQLSNSECAFVVGWLVLAAWVALSTVWSRDLAQTVLELERIIVYVGAASAVMLLAGVGSARRILAGALVAIVAVASFSLATRLFPGHLRVYDRAAIYRLSQPIGYWNGLAAFSAIGMLLAAGFAARARHRMARPLAAGAVPILLATFYFTFGRAAWIALAAGIAVAVLVDSRRLQLLTTVLVLLPASAATIWLAAHSRGLTQSGISAARAAHDGRTFALWLLLLAAGTGAAVALLSALERRVTVPKEVRHAFAGLLVLGCVAALVAVSVQYGTPSSLVRRGYAAFKAPTPHVVNLNRRLLSFSGNGRYDLWRLAWEDARAHPWLGSGAGSYERYFLQHQPPGVGRVRDAHGLYIETLAELGPVGLVVLLVTLAMPAVALVRVRREPLAAVAAGAYATFLVHAGVDWDWELPAITLVALLCGAAILLSGRQAERLRTLSAPVRGAGVALIFVLAVFATVGLVGNNALKASTDARRAGNWERAAAQARVAHRWQPWSAEPWLDLGEAQLNSGQFAEARRSFRKAASIDSRDWRVWYDLGRASTGQARRRAFARAAALYPLSGLLAESPAPNRTTPSP